MFLHHLVDFLLTTFSLPVPIVVLLELGHEKVCSIEYSVVGWWVVMVKVKGRMQGSRIVQFFFVHTQQLLFSFAFSLPGRFLLETKPRF